MSEEMITERETIALLLYLVENLKIKIFNQETFDPFQLPVLNSMIKAISENYVLPLREEELLKLMVDKDMIYTNEELQL